VPPTLALQGKAVQGKGSQRLDRGPPGRAGQVPVTPVLVAAGLVTPVLVTPGLVTPGLVAMSQAVLSPEAVSLEALSPVARARTPMRGFLLPF
jgi:hypothetical protein